MRNKIIGSFIFAVCFFSSVSAGLGQPDTLVLPKPKNAGSQSEVSRKTLSAPQVAAINLLESVLADLRNRGNNPPVVLMRARVADALWRFNEAKARETIVKAIEDLGAALPNLSNLDRKLREEQVKSIR